MKILKPDVMFKCQPSIGLCNECTNHTRTKEVHTTHSWLISIIKEQEGKKKLLKLQELIYYIQKAAITPLIKDQTF